jgi:hypothetical protein
MTDILLGIASFGVSVLIAAAIVRVVSPLVLDFRPNDRHIVIAVLVAELASEVFGAIVGLFWKPNITDITVVNLVISLVPDIVIDTLAFNEIVRDPEGNRMGVSDAGLLAIIVAAFSLVIFTIVMIWSETPLRIW